MLQITVPKADFFDEETEEFVSVKETTLRLEHSLVSISKWESKWRKPFLSPKKESKTQEESLDYIRCMTLNQNVNPMVYKAITRDNIQQIQEYIDTDQTATWFSETNRSPNRQVVTSELVYYWMTAYNIPMECQKWHFSRLMTLVRICSIENQPKKKMPKQSIMKRNTSLNAARRAAMKTKG